MEGADDLFMFNGYPCSFRCHCDSEYMGNGVYKYIITTTKYQFGQEVDRKVTEHITGDVVNPDTEPEVVGVLQAEYPDLFNIITSISDLNLDGGKYISHKKGLLKFCANCSALEAFNIDTDFQLYLGGLYDNSCAFLNCTNLIEVTLGDGLATDSSFCYDMFRNCTSLTTVNGVINIGSITMYRNMFKNCPNVTGLKLKDPTNKLMVDPEVEGFVGVGYEYLGLTSPSQFDIVE